MMKRSTSVTAVAVLLILAGGVTAQVFLTIFAAGPNAWQWKDEQLEASLRAQFHSEVPKEVLDTARIESEGMRTAIRTWMALPVVRGTYLMTGLVGLVMLVAGVGVLLLKRWARPLAVWQAYASVVLALWSAPLQYHMYQHTASAIDLDLQNLGVRREFLVPTFDPRIAIGGAIYSMLLPLIWSLFIVWFFKRPSIKAQFQQTGGSQ